MICVACSRLIEDGEWISFYRDREPQGPYCCDRACELERKRLPFNPAETVEMQRAAAAPDLSYAACPRPAVAPAWIEACAERLANLRSGGSTVTLSDPPGPAALLGGVLAALGWQVEKLAPAPGNTVVLRFPDAEQDDDGACLSAAIRMLRSVLPTGVSGLVLPPDWPIEQYPFHLVSAPAIAARLRARAATLTYEGALETARVLREEADAIERGAP